jgi:hypothetical protein
MNILVPLFWLIAAHFVIDYPLQGDTTAKQKNPNCDNPLSVHVPWYYWMTAHAIMHAAAVAYITKNPIATLCEFVAHFVIDYQKCKGHISIHTDQILHVSCKLLYCYYMFC